jgi:hypothetical protein
MVDVSSRARTEWKRPVAILLLTLTLVNSEFTLTYLGGATTLNNFELSNITIDPPQVKPNSVAGISVKITNTGENTGIYNTELKLNGNTVASKTVTLASGASEYINFNVTRSCPGVYRVVVGSLTGVLTVLKPEKNSTLTIDEAIIVPTNVSKVDYPSAFNIPTVREVDVVDPYFAIERDEIAYPVEYLGDYEYPQIVGAPLPSEIKRVVGLHDLGIPDWAFLDYTNNDGESARALERQGILQAMRRAKSLGADEITFTNMIRFKSFEKAELEPVEEVPISPDDIRFIANNAKYIGLDTTLCLNIFLMNDENPWTHSIPSENWLITLIHNWENFVLNQAQLSEETGVDALMINHFDWQPYINGYEDVYQSEMLALLEKVRAIYHGRVLFMLDSVLGGADTEKLDKFLASVDGFIVNTIPNDLSYADNKTISVSNLKRLYIDNFRKIASKLNQLNKPYLIRVLIQSEKTFLENGWNEDTHCIPRGDDPCYQQNLEVDFSVQAVAYEAMLEAVEQVYSEQSMRIYGFEATGYLFLDAILPYISQPQISQSIRDKPAEVVVYQWFKHPAEIHLTSLTISKTRVRPGEEVAVNATFQNTGDLPGNYTIVFRLDGIEKASYDELFEAGQDAKRNIKLTSSIEGIHNVTVGVHSVTFEVEKAASEIVGYPYMAVLIGLILVLLFLSNQKTRVRVSERER